MNLTILTGANEKYFETVQGTLWTLAKFSPAAKVILLDLGLTRAQSEYLANTPPFYLKDFSIRKFDFSEYPAHFSMAENSGRAAFRPVNILYAAKEFGGVVCWIDAGSMVECSLGSMLAQVATYGLFARASNGTVAQVVYPSAQTALGVTPEIAGLPMRRLGYCAFDTSKPEVMTLLQKWAIVTLDPAITAPAGSTKSNHIQGGVFAVLLAQSGFKLPTMAIGGVRKINMPLAEMRYRLGVRS